jgi:hypothetical protein
VGLLMDRRRSFSSAFQRLLVLSYFTCLIERTYDAQACCPGMLPRHMSPAVLLLLLEALSTVHLQHMPAAAVQTPSSIRTKAPNQQEGPGSLAVGHCPPFCWLITAAARLFIFFSSPAAAVHVCSKFTFRGVDLDQLLDMKSDELVTLFHARARRR